MKTKQLLFTDGSVNTQLKIGYGAYLLIHEDEITSEVSGEQVITKEFENTSSTKLELQTLIWALTNAVDYNEKVVIYSDSQNIIGLPERRKRLEQNDFRSAKNKLLNNHDLYRIFYQTIDQLDYELLKVKGHQPSVHKTNIDHLFTMVDRASRKALKKSKKSSEK